MIGGISFDHLDPTPDFGQLPIEIKLTTSRAAAMIRLLMLAPMMVMLAVPLSLIGAFASSEISTSPIDHLVSHPMIALKIGVGLTIWAALFVWPIKRLVTRMGATRRVTIDTASVTVVDSSPFGTKTWSEPLANFMGIAHHIRASLSGNRHELLLIHADRSKTLPITIVDRLSQTEFDKAKALLRLPEVSASWAYRTS